MAYKKRKATAARRTYAAAPRKKRRSSRRSYVNKNPAKPLAGLGATAGVAINAVPIAINAVKSKSASPITSAVTSVPWLMDTGKKAIGGYVGGYVLGTIMQKTKVGKKQVNKLMKKVGVI